MANVITSPTYDPVTTATNLANSYVAPTKAILDAQATKTKANTAALTTLGSALGAFQTALAGLTTGNKTVSANAATFSNTAIATGTATSKSEAGTYSFYVEQLATAGQVSYNIRDSSVPSSGGMSIKLADGSSFQVNLNTADADNDGVLTAKEIAAAVNAAAGNNARLTASTMTINGKSQLVLTSASTGKNNGVDAITFTGDPAETPTLAADLGAKTTLTAANDAIVWVGPKGSGTKIEQASNTFSIVEGVSFTVKQAQGANDQPVTMTVGADNSTTAANVQAFVTAYNTLMGVFGNVTAVGNPAAGTTSAALAGDSAVKSLRDQINTALRSATGGQSLISYGITANRDGTLSLDSNRLNKAIAADPEGLDKLFGKATTLGTNDTGVLGTMNKVVNNWTSSVNGILSARKDANAKLQTDITKRLATLEGQFNNAYQRYLAQFTALQQLQSSMTNTSNLFTELFSSSSKS